MNMTMVDMINLLVNNGMAVGITAYFLYRDYKFNVTLNKTLGSLERLVEELSKGVKNEN